ncbi:response regulator [Desulfobacter postgatei]|jgi:two-component system chemotaxis response regulator CheY|uniref:response regulator n=1 Tax=Desulfobacter postgatei TaxID=2293 RepID=UPI002A35FC25|nr:response regulator [Desulfobacter postgatei]MDX9962607.1 response regulator [Desulfobacter postgatei]
MSYSILIVDDSMPMRTVLKRSLAASGYGGSRILEASNGKEALTVLKGEWVDLIMTDYNMPEMNGLSFLKTVKTEALFKEIPVIVISTEGNDSKIKEFMDTGAAGYITKPFTPEALRDLIVSIIGEADYEESIDDSDNEFDF